MRYSTIFASRDESGNREKWTQIFVGGNIIFGDSQISSNEVCIRVYESLLFSEYWSSRAKYHRYFCHLKLDGQKGN